MNASQLAAQSIRETHRFAGILDKLICEQLALGHVARWLYQQDPEEVSNAKARAVANEAISIIVRHF